MKFYKSDNIAENLGNLVTKELVEISKEIYVESGKTNLTSANIGFDLYEIKTVSAVTDTGDPVTVSIYSGSGGEEELYRSLTQPIIQDIVQIPVRDKSGAKSIYFAVSNKTISNVKATVKIKVVSM